MPPPLVLLCLGRKCVRDRHHCWSVGAAIITLCGARLDCASRQIQIPGILPFMVSKLKSVHPQFSCLSIPVFQWSLSQRPTPTRVLVPFSRCAPPMLHNGAMRDMYAAEQVVWWVFLAQSNITRKSKSQRHQSVQECLQSRQTTTIHVKFVFFAKAGVIRAFLHAFCVSPFCVRSIRIPCEAWWIQRKGIHTVMWEWHDGVCLCSHCCGGCLFCCKQFGVSFFFSLCL